MSLTKIKNSHHHTYDSSWWTT